MKNVPIFRRKSRNYLKFYICKGRLSGGHKQQERDNPLTITFRPKQPVRLPSQTKKQTISQQTIVPSNQTAYIVLI